MSYDGDFDGDMQKDLEKAVIEAAVEVLEKDSPNSIEHLKNMARDYLASQKKGEEIEEILPMPLGEIKLFTLARKVDEVIAVVNKLRVK